jgi:hypothetical protein
MKIPSFEDFQKNHMEPFEFKYTDKPWEVKWPAMRFHLRDALDRTICEAMDNFNELCNNQVEKKLDS